jgi:hypothetical protein
MIVQGDVFFTKVRAIPQRARRVSRSERGYIIAEGEATGHAHIIKDNVELYENDGVLFIKTSKTVEVRHEEHLPVTLNPGIWKVGIVREYDPFLEEIRIVRD